MRLTASLLLLLLLLAPAGPAAACFGPKLYIGAGSGAEERFLHALVVLYVKEKTGVETETVATTAGVSDLQQDRLDLAFAPAGTAGAVLAPARLPVLLAGRRVREDLQFTTVLPSLRKLDGLIAGIDLRPQVDAVAAGAAPLATARAFLTARGWL